MREYIVKQGDTLSKIAKDFGTTVSNLQAINSITNPNNIKVGQILRLELQQDATKTDLNTKINQLINYIEGKKIQRVLSPEQKSNIRDIINTCIKEKVTDLRMISYILATVFWETARTFKPIEEIGKGKGRPYGIPHKTTRQVYYGRGYVQITWFDNYERFTKLLRNKGIQVDLVNNPERACEHEIAKLILVMGMRDGRFTGADLDDYFSDTKTDWYNARRIINGLDKAVTIKEIAEEFYYILKPND